MIKFFDDHQGFIAFIAVVIAAVLAIRQLRSSEKSQKEATAKEIFKEYLLIAFEHPAFSVMDSSVLKVKPDGLEFERYKWFVSYMLFACEEILDLFPNSKEWTETIERNLGYHKNYLKIPDPEFKIYSKELRDVIDRIKRLK
jgi:hypothetical protein